MTELKPRTLIPVADVLKDAQNHVSPKYDTPLADLFVDGAEYTIYLGKESARHKKCYLMLEGRHNETKLKFQSEYTENSDLPDLFKSLIQFAESEQGVMA